MKINNQLYFLTILSYSLLGCNKRELDFDKGDFVKFEVNSVERNYKFQDSVLQFCEPDFFRPKDFRFIISKTYNSSEPEFHSLTISIDQVAEACPLNHLENNNVITFILTKSEGNEEFIDYTSWNVNKLDQLEWGQELLDGKIIVKGKFDGWLYKYFHFRPSEFYPEPQKLDSIFVRNGQFQLTLK